MRVLFDVAVSNSHATQSSRSKRSLPSVTHTKLLLPDAVYRIVGPNRLRTKYNGVTVDESYTLAEIGRGPWRS
jgi:hypothetical protein